MDAILASLRWDSDELPSPGSHSTLPEDDIQPWRCISEVIPGLYLTCASEMVDKTKCVAMGISLVINMCGEDHASKYRVFEENENLVYAFRQIDTQDSFFWELSNYCSLPLTCSKTRRKVFVLTIPAEDTPTYSIDRHFVECAVLIEIVMRSRAFYEMAGNEDYTAIPAVSVHCMVGVSRSASIVAAYLMKKYSLSQDDAIHMIRCTRPVVQPNPGFQRQLSIWEALQSYRVFDEWSGKVLACEAKTKLNLIQMASTMLPVILRTNKCETERRFFGLLIKSAEPTETMLHGVYRELRSVVAAEVDSEIYTDIPNYFGYVAEVVCSIDCAVPAVLQYATDFRNSLVCNDAFYYRVVKDVARSGFEKDTFDTTRGFSSLFESIHVKHLSVSNIGHPVPLNSSEGSSPLPPAFALSFPFLFLVAPYAEGFVQFSEGNALVNEFTTTGEVLSATDLQRLRNETVRLFLQYFFRSSCVAEGSGAIQSYTKLGYLQSDTDVTTFRAVESHLKCGGASIVSLESVVTVPQPVDSNVAFLLHCKVLSGVVAFRLLLEAADLFLSQTYGARLGESISLADELLPLSVISQAVMFLESAYMAAHCKPSRAGDFFRVELWSLLETGVLNPAGVVSLFQALA